MPPPTTRPGERAQETDLDVARQFAGKRQPPTGGENREGEGSTLSGSQPSDELACQTTNSKAGASHPIKECAATARSSARRRLVGRRAVEGWLRCRTCQALGSLRLGERGGRPGGSGDGRPTSGHSAAMAGL